jgi:hypothetical protein
MACGFMNSLAVGFRNSLTRERNRARSSSRDASVPRSGLRAPSSVAEVAGDAGAAGVAAGWATGAAGAVGEFAGHAVPTVATVPSVGAAGDAGAMLVEPGSDGGGSVFTVPGIIGIAGAGPPGIIGIAGGGTTIDGCVALFRGCG